MKVIVTGLGVAHDFGICSNCSVNYSWLFKNPSVFLWADKIIIPKLSFNEQLKHTESKTDKAISLLLQIADSAGIIELVDVQSMYEEDISSAIVLNSMEDANRLLSEFPQCVTKGSDGVPNEILIEDFPYCAPYISSINASQILAHKLGATCLFSQKDHVFLKYKYGLLSSKSSISAPSSIFNEVFTPLLPNELTLHNYAFEDDGRCIQCKNHSSCKESYLKQIEISLTQIIGWREYDEIHRATEELQRIVDQQTHVNNAIDLAQIKKEYEEKQIKINRNIRRVFPQIKRWTTLTTMIATPFTIINAITGSPVATAIGGISAGAAKIVEQAMSYYERKHSWVSFINKPIGR